jgi:hypothetical protein
VVNFLKFYINVIFVVNVHPLTGRCREMARFNEE